MKHIHHDTIIAWAAGAKIQARNIVYNGFWQDVDAPIWALSQEYRIKPEPKPDVIKYTVVGESETGSGNHHTAGCWSHPPSLSSFEGSGATKYIPKGTIKMIFDGETGKLKSTEVINEA